jgi:hypothetical protein
LTARPYQAIIPQEFIRYVRDHTNVWFPRCTDVAQWWLEQYRGYQVETWPNYLSMTTPPVISTFSLVG